MELWPPEEIASKKVKLSWRTAWRGWAGGRGSKPAALNSTRPPFQGITWSVIKLPVQPTCHKCIRVGLKCASATFAFNWPKGEGKCYPSIDQLISGRFTMFDLNLCRSFVRRSYKNEYCQITSKISPPPPSHPHVGHFKKAFCGYHRYYDPIPQPEVNIGGGFHSRCIWLIFDNDDYDESLMIMMSFWMVMIKF